MTFRLVYTQSFRPLNRTPCMPDTLIVNLSYLRELGPIEHAIKLSNKVGVIRSVFLGTYLRWKVKTYDARLSNVLQSFQVCPQFATYLTCLICHLQATLAFDPHFVQSAERIEVCILPLLRITIY